MTLPQPPKRPVGGASAGGGTGSLEWEEERDPRRLDPDEEEPERLRASLASCFFCTTLLPSDAALEASSPDARVLICEMAVEALRRCVSAP